MDGSSILAGFLEPARRFQEAVVSSPFGSLGGLLVAWILFPHFFRTAFSFVLAGLYA
jgi:hypothetical protein